MSDRRHGLAFTAAGEDGDLRELPIDSDIEGAEAQPQRRTKRRLPRLDPGVLAAVYAGGLAGGLARYGIGVAVPASAGHIPWDIFGINVGGAFALALLLVLLTDVFRPSRYLRPAFGTGFLGAFTTFSSLTTATDQLLSHGHVALAAGYALGSLVGGLAAASFGLAVGHAISVSRQRARAARRAEGVSR